MQLREDLQLIYRWIEPESKILDLGCGDGALLAALVGQKQCSGYGVELDSQRVIAAMGKKINVIQADLERGLHVFADDSFDLVVLSQTIQAMKNVEFILHEMMRIAQQAIVTFPNFGYWRNRLQLTLGGHMPVSESMPYQWYDTPNIHWCTLRDFDRLCAQNRIAVLERTVMSSGRRIDFLPNLLGSLAVYRIGRAAGFQAA